MLKKIFVGGILILCFSNFIGCDINLTKFPRIPFEHFILQDTEETKDIELNKLTKYIKIEELEKTQKNISKLFDTICNETYYYNNYYKLDKFYNDVKELFSNEYYDKLISNKNQDLKKIADNIYYKEHQVYKESNIIEMGVDNDNEKYFIVDVIYLNDTQSFIIDEIKVYIDENLKIINTQLISEMNSVVNTIKPLSSKDSLLDDNELDKFSKVLLDFFNNMKNQELYNMVIEENNELQLSTLIENIKLENKNNETLKNLFLIGRGRFDNYEITDYYINDKDGLANSYYIISFVNGKTIKKFLFEYSRITGTIVSVSEM